jgi:hypothetical protein
VSDPISASKLLGTTEVALTTRGGTFRCWPKVWPRRYKTFSLRPWRSGPGNTKGGSITVPLTSCLTGLESAVWQLTIFVFIFILSKPVKQEVNGTVILSPLVFPVRTYEQGNTYRRERLATVELLIIVACFGAELNNMFNTKLSWFKLFSTRRSTILRFPLNKDSLLELSWSFSAMRNICSQGQAGLIRSARYKPWNTNCRGRLCTVDLLIKAVFCNKFK